MTPAQKIRTLILIKAAEIDRTFILPPLNPSNIDQHYENLCEIEGQWEAIGIIRSGEVSTDIDCPAVADYWSKLVAAKYLDGSWVGWTLYYGGGDHGEPESIDWIEHAYDLTVTGEKLVTVLSFEKTAQS